MGIFIFLHVFLLIGQEQFNKEKIETWYGDVIGLKNTNDETKNAVWNKASSDAIRKTAIKGIVKEIRNINAGAGEPRPSNNPLEIIGFEKAGIVEWKKDLTIVTGKTFEIDLIRIPPEAVKLEYIPQKEGSFAQLKYTLKDGSTIVIEGGKLNEDLSYTSDAIPTSTDEKEKMQLIPGKGEIKLGSKGEIGLANRAQIKIGDKTFSQQDTANPSELSIVEESWFVGKNLKVQTKDFLIKSDGTTLTHFVFKKDFAKNLVHAGENLVRIYDGDLRGTTGKQVIMSGENIEVKVINPKLIGPGKVYVSGNGKNLRIINGDVLSTITDKNTFVRRRIETASVNTEIKNEQKPEQTITTEVKPPKINEGTSVSPPGTSSPPATENPPTSGAQPSGETTTPTQPAPPTITQVKDSQGNVWVQAGQERIAKQELVDANGKPGVELTEKTIGLSQSSYDTLQKKYTDEASKIAAVQDPNKFYEEFMKSVSLKMRIEAIDDPGKYQVQSFLGKVDVGTDGFFAHPYSDATTGGDIYHQIFGGKVKIGQGDPAKGLLSDWKTAGLTFTTSETQKLQETFTSVLSYNPDAKIIKTGNKLQPYQTINTGYFLPQGSFVDLEISSGASNLNMKIVDSKGNTVNEKSINLNTNPVLQSAVKKFELYSLQYPDSTYKYYGQTASIGSQSITINSRGDKLRSDFVNVPCSQMEQCFK